MTSRMVMVLSVFFIAMVILVFAAAVQAVEKRAEDEAWIRRWEKKCNMKYRDDPDAALGRV